MGRCFGVREELGTPSNIPRVSLQQFLKHAPLITVYSLLLNFIMATTGTNISHHYSLDEEHHESDSGNHQLIEHMDFSWKLKLLERKGLAIQYQLACLSTLGGAYHLTNRPETAFMIAYRQELVGRLLGSMNVIIRAKVFQAVNLSLLGYQRKSKQVFATCKRLALDNSWAGMTPFVTASERWLRTHRALKNADSGSVSGAVDLAGSEWRELESQSLEESRSTETMVA
jgi:hypothetical protein